MVTAHFVAHPVADVCGSNYTQTKIPRAPLFFQADINERRPPVARTASKKQSTSHYRILYDNQLDAFEPKKRPFA